MTEYWKSYAKKYCDVCKCWITDNKASVQFHESGKRHKENVGKKINELVKKATKENKEKKQLDDDMRKMEEAALKAYMQDVEQNPDHSAQFVKEKLDTSAEPKETTQSESQSSKEKHRSKDTVKAEGSKNISKVSDDSKCGIQADRVWYEAVSEQGHTYYWNTQTNESAWEAPKGYVTLDEQNKETEKQKSAADEKEKCRQVAEKQAAKVRNEEVRAAVERERMREKYSKPQASSAKEEEQEEDEDEEEEEEETVVNPMGPQTRVDPYGAWTTVAIQEVPEVDLQLPPSYQPTPQPVVFTAVEPRVKIKEKILDPSKLGCSDEPASFKKRKISHRGNARQRFDDD